VGLPARVQQVLRREATTQVLMLVVDTGRPSMMARVGMVQALNAGQSEPLEARRKSAEKFLNLVTNPFIGCCSG
jgi:hypothetical protein